MSELEIMHKLALLSYCIQQGHTVISFDNPMLLLFGYYIEDLSATIEIPVKDLYKLSLDNAFFKKIVNISGKGNVLSSLNDKNNEIHNIFEPYYDVSKQKYDELVMVKVLQ